MAYLRWGNQYCGTSAAAIAFNRPLQYQLNKRGGGRIDANQDDLIDALVESSRCRNASEELREGLCVVEQPRLRMPSDWKP
jgi:hypothetical protein